MEALLGCMLNLRTVRECGPAAVAYASTVRACGPVAVACASTVHACGPVAVACASTVHACGWHFARCAGKGKFSTVYRARLKDSGLMVALKKIQVLPVLLWLLNLELTFNIGCTCVYCRLHENFPLCCNDNN